jgi:hypothetical protein
MLMVEQESLAQSAGSSHRESWHDSLTTPGAVRK